MNFFVLEMFKILATNAKVRAADGILLERRGEVG